MRRYLMASSLLAMTLALSACGDGASWPWSESVSDQQQAGWTEETARQLRDAIAARATHGLDRISFASGGEPDSADGKTALTRAALAYAGALARGATEPTRMYDIFTVPRPNPDLRLGLASALRSNKLDAWLQSLAPQDSHYQRLSQQYVTLRKQNDAPKPAIAPMSEPIHPGASDPRIAAVARQLVEYDYLDRAAARGDRYTPAMVAAMKAMQTDYGIKPDGVIGSDVLAILNLSDAERARAIAVNMEQLRWLVRNPPPTRIDVNLATARLSYWRDGKLVDVRRVVVGKPDTQTPQLGSHIFRLVANPTWTVPRSIEKKEIAAKGPGYLQANDMSWKDGWIVQNPGPKNSLGLVKFDMTGKHAIYLHDTPAKPLFKLVQRQRSHGCVRVEDALGFAELLARDEGISEQWREALATGEETFVPLPREMPVRMLYQTVLFDASGEPVLRADPYEWNDRIAAKLGFAARATYRLKSNEADIGP